MSRIGENKETNMVNQSKKNQVESLSSSLQKSPNFILVKIEKTSHKSLEELRRELRKNDSAIKVIKNAFFEKAVNKLTSSNKVFADLRKKFFPMKEPSAIITFSKSWDKGLKAFYQFSKKEKTLGFKLGLVDNKIYSAEEISFIADLPSREELFGKIIGSMKSPMSKFIYALKYNTNKFVYILNAKSKGVSN